MRLLFLAHMWCPSHNAGGETTVHAAMRAMVRRGHEVDVICRPQSEEFNKLPESYEFEGVRVWRCPRQNDYQWIADKIKEVDPDLLFTHLDLTTVAMQLSIDTGRPLAHFFHNTMSIPVFHVGPHKCQLAIFNSHWVAKESDWENRIDHHMEEGGKFRPRQIIIHPVVEPERYRCKPGTKITLINPTPGKGENTFYSLARAMPEYEFLTVKSVYGEQVAWPNITPPPNVETMEHTPDIREVFEKTKILLMPSDYESYGRAAVEAACSGIPSIVHPTPGLLEALGAERAPTKEELEGGWVSGAGIFCSRIKDILCNAGPMTREIVERENVANLNSWKAQIERLMTDDVYYRSRSDAALKLVESFDPESEFDRLEEALLITGRDWTRAQDDDRSKMWTADRRIYRRADGTLTDDKSQALSLYCAEGNPMPLDEAIEYGFTSHPAVTVTPGMNTDDLTEGKMVDGPTENKAILAPEENKSRKRKAA